MKPGLTIGQTERALGFLRGIKHRLFKIDDIYGREDYASEAERLAFGKVGAVIGQMCDEHDEIQTAVIAAQRGHLSEPDRFVDSRADRNVAGLLAAARERARIQPPGLDYVFTLRGYCNAEGCYVRNVRADIKEDDKAPHSTRFFCPSCGRLLEQVEVLTSGEAEG